MRIPGIPYVQGRNTYGTSTKRGVAIHNTSNDATAEQEASYATRRTDGTSAHLYVDNNSIVQSLDTITRAGHAGSRTGNDHAVAVEITGVNGWTRQQWLDRVAWDKLGAALAHVVREYGIEVRRASVAEMRDNPRVKAFYGHDDMRRAWGGTTHTDPGPNFPWDRLFSAVNSALGTTTGEDDDMPTVGEIWAAAWGETTRETAGQRLAMAAHSARDALAEIRATRTAVTALAEARPDVDTDAILARMDALAAEDRARDAELRELVERGLSGELAADEVVRLIGERLVATGGTAGTGSA